MKIVLVSALLVAVAAFAQNPSATPMGDHNQQHMQAMHEHMNAMRADIQKLNMSLNSIRSSLPRINNLDERNRWEQTIEMWQVLINHMQQMTGEHEGHGAPAAEPAAKPR
jgi:uncharacterized protein YpuA (DUF1002 family)